MYNSHYSGTLEIPLKGSDNVLEISRSNLPNPAELFEILRSEEAPLRHYVLFAVTMAPLSVVQYRRNLLRLVPGNRPFN